MYEQATMQHMNRPHMAPTGDGVSGDLIHKHRELTSHQQVENPISKRVHSPPGYLQVNVSAHQQYTRILKPLSTGL